MVGQSQTGKEVAVLREELRQRLASWAAGVLNLLAIALLVIIVVRFAVPVSPEWTRRLNRLAKEIWVVFLLDFVIQVTLAPRKWQFLRHNWLLVLSVFLPAVRVIHVIRLLVTVPELSMAQVFAVADNATRTLGRMLRGHQFGRALLLTGIVIVVGAAGLVYFEDLGPGHYGEALWWSAAFVSTVGSNFQPRTVEGRILALLLVAWGLGVAGYVTAAIASYFIGSQAEEDSDAAELREIALLRQDMAELKAMLAQTLAQPGAGTERTSPPAGQEQAE